MDMSKVCEPQHRGVAKRLCKHSCATVPSGIHPAKAVMDMKVEGIDITVLFPAAGLSLMARDNGEEVLRA